MAKALYGHLAADPVTAVEVARLRRRVRELEADLARLRAERAAAAADAPAQDAPIAELVDELLELDARQEPALT